MKWSVGKHRNANNRIVNCAVKKYPKIGTPIFVPIHNRKMIEEDDILVLCDEQKLLSFKLKKKNYDYEASMLYEIIS